MVELIRYSPCVGRKFWSSVTRDTEKLSSWFTSMVNVPSGFFMYPSDASV